MQLISFSLTPENKAGLPTDRVAEVLSLEPSHVTPIPDMPAGVMGVCNWRSQVLWLVDLAYLLGLGSLFSQDLDERKYTVLVVRNKSKVLGLAVKELGNMMGYDRSQIQPPPKIAMPQMQVLTLCLKGQIINPNGKNMLILDANPIMEFLAKHRHQ
ncbi:MULTISPECIES: chemotaxis protein CheW [Aerosakkonema]|uniref:chemotaxis protein CheW n=1 Tax=Aerosakkonema TaxID=1246629 RepID=UPI0035B7B14A